MAQKSMAWFTDGFDGAVGDGATPYTQEEWRAKEYTFFGDGVDPIDGNKLAVTGTASPLSMATGRAQVAGFHYWNDAALNLTVPTPTTGTTGGRVVLRAEWAGASEATVRAAVKMSADGTATMPALTQTVLTTYEIGIASFTITTAGVITVTDTRVTRPLIGELPDASVTAAKAGAGLATLTRRQNGAGGWFAPGTTNVTTGNILEQVGVIAVTIDDTDYTGSANVTFPIAFNGAAQVVCSMIADDTSQQALRDAMDSGKLVAPFALPAGDGTGVEIGLSRTDDSGAVTLSVAWRAVGTRA